MTEPRYTRGMSVAILSIGTELTRGEIQNTNATWLSDQVTSLGLSVGTCVTIADDPDVIVRTLQRLGAEHQVILSTGGLGPTTDDITAENVARCLGVKLTRHAESYAALQAWVARRGRTLSASNAKQADLPEGSTALSNAVGTAPGFSVTILQARAHFMPGVPSEMRPMFTEHVLPTLAALTSTYTASRKIKTFGAPESSVNDTLAGIEAEHDVVIGYRAHFPEIEVKVLATRATRVEAERSALAVAALVEARLGSLVYGHDQDTLPAVVLELLRKRRSTLGCAESCTGGLLSALLTEQPASDVFLGAVVSYANAIKTGILRVASASLEQHGAVSEVVVQEMALGARHALGCDYALAISGIAGPSGGTADKPVGRVCLALATPSSVEIQIVNFVGTRRQIQTRAAFAALNLLRLHLAQ